MAQRPLTFLRSSPAAVTMSLPLGVKGTSMIDALINDGDMVLMQAAQSADNGDMVAVWIKDQQEVTLKKIYYEGDKVRLQPANTQMEPIYTQAKDVEVQGKVVGVHSRIIAQVFSREIPPNSPSNSQNNATVCGKP